MNAWTGLEWRMRGARCRLSWDEVEAVITRFSASLRQRGLRPEDAVAMYSRSSADQLLAEWAVADAGARLVTIAPNADVEAARGQLRDAGVRVLFIDRVSRLERLVADGAWLASTELSQAFVLRDFDEPMAQGVEPASALLAIAPVAAGAHRRVLASAVAGEPSEAVDPGERVFLAAPLWHRGCAAIAATVALRRATLVLPELPVYSYDTCRLHRAGRIIASESYLHDLAVDIRTRVAQSGGLRRRLAQGLLEHNQGGGSLSDRVLRSLLRRRFGLHGVDTIFCPDALGDEDRRVLAAMRVELVTGGTT